VANQGSAASSERLNRWHERYSEKGLRIVGVHSPEFDSEKKIENVRRQVASLGIRFPVVTDNEYEIWRAYKVKACDNLCTRQVGSHSLDACW